MKKSITSRTSATTINQTWMVKTVIWVLIVLLLARLEHVSAGMQQVLSFVCLYVFLVCFGGFFIFPLSCFISDHHFGTKQTSAMLIQLLMLSLAYTGTVCSLMRILNQNEFRPVLVTLTARQERK